MNGLWKDQLPIQEFANCNNQQVYKWIKTVGFVGFPLKE